MNAPPVGKLSPLWIISLFVTFTEVVLGYAVTKTTDWIQASLTVFVIVFALLVFGAFFLVLWHKPNHFYAPGDYGGMSPREFVDALRRFPNEAVEQVARLSQNPNDKQALDELLNALLDRVFSAKDARLSGKEIRLEAADGETNIGYWTELTDFAVWNVGVLEPGNYSVTVTQSSQPKSGGGQYELLLGGERLVADVVDTNSWSHYIDRQIGCIKVGNANRYEMQIKALRKGPEALMNVKRITLRRVAN